MLATLFLPTIMLLYSLAYGEDVLDAYYPFFYAIFFGGMFCSMLLEEVVTCFGIPPILTFGYRIDAVKSEICTPDQPNGLPCVLKDLKEWTLRFRRGYRGCELGSLRPAERKLVGTVLLVGVLLLFTMVPGKFGMPHLIRQAHEREMEEVKGLERLKARVAELEVELAGKKVSVSPESKC